PRHSVEILDARTREKLCFLDKVEPHATIAEIKSLFTKAHPQWYPARQSLRLDPSKCHRGGLGCPRGCPRVRGAAAHLPALLLPRPLPLRPPLRLHRQPPPRRSVSWGGRGGGQGGFGGSGETKGVAPGGAGGGPGS
uniref:TECR-like N-terminal domain-containing protein n=1 Tax=Aquila chrysaetos chrysaetos TaxID=223781 RepID=A0A663DXF5_AQUCH